MIDKMTLDLVHPENRASRIMLSTEQCAILACLLDVTAPKPGNVHRGADFEDTTFLDYAASAVAIGPAMRDAVDRRVGRTVLDAIRATRAVTPRNTNLGIVLLPVRCKKSLTCRSTSPGASSVTQ